MMGRALAQSSAILGDLEKIGLLTPDSILVRAQLLFLLLPLLQHLQRHKQLKLKCIHPWIPS